MLFICLKKKDKEKKKKTNNNIEISKLNTVPAIEWVFHLFIVVPVFHNKTGIEVFLNLVT